MNSFDIILISITGVIVLIGLIFGLTKGGRFFLTLAGSVSISAFVMIPVMKIIGEQEWFVNLSKIFLGHNMLSVVFYFALLGLATFIIHFILNLLFKLIGLTVKDEKFVSHIGGLFLGLCGLSMIIYYFLFGFILKAVGSVIAEKRVASHTGGFLLGVLNCVFLLFAVLVAFDFVKDKVDVSSLNTVYDSFAYSFFRPVVSSFNAIGGK